MTTGTTISTDTPATTQYELRVRLVRDVVKANSELSEQAATDLAVRMLHVLDTVPEHVR